MTTMLIRPGELCQHCQAPEPATAVVAGGCYCAEHATMAQAALDERVILHLMDYPRTEAEISYAMNRCVRSDELLASLTRLMEAKRAELTTVHHHGRTDRAWMLAGVVID